MPEQSEPDYWSQSDNPESHAERLMWLHVRIEEAKRQGCTWGRVSFCPEGEWPGLNLILYEGWKKRPDDEGLPRWQLTHATS